MLDFADKDENKTKLTMTGEVSMDKVAFNLGKELSKKKQLTSKPGQKKPRGRTLLDVFGFNRDNKENKRPLL